MLRQDKYSSKSGQVVVDFICITSVVILPMSRLLYNSGHVVMAIMGYIKIR